MCNVIECFGSRPVSNPIARGRYCSSANLLLFSSLFAFIGCGSPRDNEQVTSVQAQVQSDQASPQSEASNQNEDGPDRVALLERRLSEQECAEGWVNLFDGVTLFGWHHQGQANFRVEDGLLVVDQGEKSLLCTAMKWDHYELVVEYRADELTNSGIFLSTSPQPGDITKDCYEVNIAPESHPFSTGSLVERKAATNVPNANDADAWRTMRIVHQSDEIVIQIDGVEVCQYQDEQPPQSGQIGLQYNQGKVEFRKVMIRPLGLSDLLDEKLSAWKQYREMEAVFSVTESGAMHVQGGSGQIETQELFGDFVLLAQYKLPTPEMNSGIFFRCIPGDKMMGYECQVSNYASKENSLVPADCGAGGIFRRQDARLIAGETDKWATILLQVQGPSMAAWVNGVQVSGWTDDREVNENPRRGKRLEAGTIMIQGHDPGTDALFQQLKIRPLN